MSVSNNKLYQDDVDRMIFDTIFLLKNIIIIIIIWIVLLGQQDKNKYFKI